MERELTLEEIHAELMCQLRDILAVCERHGIEYNLMCGTLLGAVRHKGFIPWDDDVDLLMTRGEFTKFREVYPKECDERFELTYLDTWTQPPSPISLSWIRCRRKAGGESCICCTCICCRG